MYEDRASAQVSGVVVRNCGTTGNIITAALSPLNIFSSAFGVLVDCQISQGCIQVRVDVPANDRIVDIDICDLGKSLVIEHARIALLVNYVVCLFLSCR